MTDFKIGDRVKVKKLSEKEFEKTYNSFSYKTYLREYSKYFGNIYIINYFKSRYIVLSGIGDIFCPDELVKVNTLKTRLNLIKELIK
jgi:hypothetical protein